MLVRMLTDVAGAGGVLAQGDVVELADDFAMALCSEPVEQPRAEPVAVRAVERAETRVIVEPVEPRAVLRADLPASHAVLDGGVEPAPEPKRRGRPPKVA